MRVEDKIRGKRVLVVEDGPTSTHGEMSYGAATLKTRELGGLIIDPRPYAIGSFKEAFKKYRHLGKVLPALGYGRDQMDELEAVINEAECDLVVLGTPTDIRRYLKVNKPIVRVEYGVEEESAGGLREAVFKGLGISP